MPYPVENFGPALQGDALEHGQHGKGEVVEVGDAIVRTFPKLLKEIWVKKKEFIPHESISISKFFNEN